MNSKKLKGFTFVELVTRITIVSILFFSSVIAYKEYVKSCFISNVNLFLPQLCYVQHNTFYNFSGNFSQKLNIDTRNNKYFKFFETIPEFISKSISSYPKRVNNDLLSITVMSLYIAIIFTITVNANCVWTLILRNINLMNKNTIKKYFGKSVNIFGLIPGLIILNFMPKLSMA